MKFGIMHNYIISQWGGFLSNLFIHLAQNVNNVAKKAYTDYQFWWSVCAFLIF